MADPHVVEVAVTATSPAPDPAAPKAAPELTKVEVVASEPPVTPHRRRGEDPHRRFEDLSWREQGEAMFKFLCAPWVEHWRGWSLTRVLATWAAYWTVEIAHHWLETLQWANKEPGWSFALFVLGGFFLAAVVALGAKYIDHLLTIVAAKIGIALTNPVADGPRG